MSERAEDRARRIAEEAKHEEYTYHMEPKHSSYQFHYKTNPTPEQLRRGPLWGVRRFSDFLINLWKMYFQHKEGCEMWEENSVWYLLPLATPGRQETFEDMHDMAGHVLRESIGKGVLLIMGINQLGHWCLIGIRYYLGEKITNNEANWRYGYHNNPYTIKGTQRVLNERTRRCELRNIRGAPLLDSALIRGETALINHNPHHEANCRFSSEHSERQGWVYKIRANRPIMNGEELYVDYGDAYGDFNSPNFPSFTTQSKHAKATSRYW